MEGHSPEPEEEFESSDDFDIEVSSDTWSVPFEDDNDIRGEPGGSCYPLEDIDADHEIRIFELLPGYFEEDLIGSLRTEKLLSSGADSPPVSPLPEYEALSYCWGSYAKTETIRISGCSELFHITSNLWHALRRLRRHKTRFLWIDQICIKQFDDLERAKQVQMMGDIYQHASRVNVWLGDLPRKQDSADSMTSLRNLFNIEHVEPTLDWRKRVWVVQEVAKAKHPPFIVFGQYEMPWDALDYSRSSLSFDHPLILLIIAKNKFRAPQTKDGYSGIAALLGIVFNTNASDPRDKVFALRSLLSPQKRKLIEPNYDKPVHRVYAEATANEISDTQSLLLLGISPPHRTQAGRMIALPTWSFDFNINMERDQEHHIMVTEALFRGPGWTQKTAGRTLAVRYDALDGALSIKGLAIGRLEHVWFEGGFRGGENNSAAAHMQDELADLSESLCIHERLSGLLGGRVRRQSLPKPRFLSERFVPSVFEMWSQTTQKHLNWNTAVVNPCPWDVLADTLWERFNPSWNKWKGYFDRLGLKGCTFLTETGFLGVGPESLEAQDLVVLPLGSAAPMVLRDDGDGKFTFEGFVFVHGVMLGELVTNAPDLELEEREFVLV